MRTIALFLLALCFCCSASAATKSASLADIKEFATIEKLMPFEGDASPYPQGVYLRSLRDRLAKAPADKRAALLDKLTQQTAWGSYQRFMACYVSAWYGVSYSRNRAYLTHCAFWFWWHIGPESCQPFSFDDVSIDLLYALFEHNQDFQILHDILTTKSDAGTSELIVCLTQEAIVKHPRGVLHVAAISENGRKLAYDLLHLSPRNEDNPVYILCDTQDSLKAFRAYVTRVANAPKDPLCALAKDLLRKRGRSK